MCYNAKNILVHKNTLPHRWLSSYFAVLMPMIFLSICILIFSACALQAGMEDLRAAETGVLTERLNEIGHSASTMAASVHMDVNRNGLMGKEIYSVQDHIRLNDFRKNLSVMQTAISCCDNLCVYFSQSGYLVEPMRAMSLNNYRRLSLQPFGENIEDPATMNMLEYRTPGELTAFWYENGNSLAAYVYTISLPSNSETYCTIVALLNLDDMLDELHNTLSNTPEMAIVSAQGTFLAATSHFPRAVFSSEVLVEESGVFQVDDWNINYQKTDMGGYVLRAEPGHGLLHLLIWPVIVSAIAAFVCCYMSFFYTRKHYSPVSELIALVDREDYADGNEYERIHNALSDAVERRRNERKLADVQCAYRSDARFMQELKGATGAECLRAKFLAERQALQHNCWCMGEVVPLDITEERIDNFDFVEIALYHCRQIFVDALRKNFACIGVVESHRILLFIQLPSEEDMQIALIKHHINEALQLIRETETMDCRCYLSAICHLEGNWQGTYQKMLDQLAAVRRLPEGSVQPVMMFHQRLTDNILLRQLNRANQLAVEGKCAQVYTVLEEILRTSHAPNVGEDNTADSEEFTIKQRIVFLIREQYADPNLNVTEIANRLGRNADALSRAFRATTNISILDYIHYVRINAAKALLVGKPEMTIREVGQVCGYTNVDTFLRAFRRVTATTPGKYREDMKNRQ